MPVALGLDFGTTTLSAIAIRPDGSTAARLTHVHDAVITGLAPGRSEFRMTTLWDAAIAALGRLNSELRGEQPVCLGFSAQMHGGLLVDDRLNPVTELINWQDKRALETAPGAKADVWTELLDRATPDAMEPTGG